MSLSHGVFPKPLGQAIISPILKKPSLDCNELANYRPVSNIKFVSKLIEKVVCKQINQYMYVNSLSEINQSAYTPNRSTETALIKVKNEMLNAVDNQKVVLLVLLDLSAAFDTIDHDVLLSRLKKNLGISGNVLKWVHSYLSNRITQVHIDGFFSDALPLIYGLPQGSVVGPLMYVIYTLPIGEIIRKYGLTYHLYADDTHILTSFNPKIPGARDEALRKLELCINELNNWLCSNKLKLNGNKTEFFVAGTLQTLSTLSPVELKVGDSVIKPSDTVRNLGIIFDSHLSMTRHINSLISSISFQLRNIRRIKRFLDHDTLHSVVRALVLSRLDYGNALLYGAKSKDLDRLQSLQHKAVKLIFSAARRDSPSPLMHKLHWLPVRERINFKVCLYIFKCLEGSAPEYLINLISLRQPHTGPVTRSSMDKTQITTYVGRNKIGDRAFQAAAPRLWNCLPRNIREACSVTSFKKLLKSHYYAY